MRRMLAGVLATVLATPAVTPAAQDSPSAGSFSLIPEPIVSCIVAGTNPLMQARLDPLDKARTGRVYFKSALGADYYYVELSPASGVYAGSLPRPLAGAGPISFYFEGLSSDLALVRSEDFQAIVVEKEADCGSRPVALLGSGEPVRVYSIAGGTAAPAGFSGVGAVAAGGSITTGAGAAAGAAVGGASGGGFLSGTTLIIAGAAALGIATAVVVITNDDEKKPPTSPSR